MSVPIDKIHFGKSGGLVPVIVQDEKTKQVYGTQFHPEKSGIAGERILKNFVAMCRN